MEWSEMAWSFLPAVIGGIIAAFWGKISKLMTALKELADVLTVVTKSLEDKNISREEATQIRVEIMEAVAAFKGILK